jgi:hypothetical protein
MTQDEQRYFDNFFDLFNTEGWKQFHEELSARAKYYSISKVKNTEELYFAKGELSVLEMVLNFESYIHQTLDSVDDEDNQDIDL